MTETRTTVSEVLGQYPVLLTFRDIEEITGIPATTLYRWHKQDRLPFRALQVGKVCRVHADQLASFLDRFNKTDPDKRRRGRPRKEEQYQVVGR